LDYFGARYYSGAQGRFASPDPMLNSGRPDIPQSWNRYAYAFNNPITFFDPNGLWSWEASDCGGNAACDEYYIFNQKRFRGGMKYLKSARDQFDEASPEYNRLKTAYDAYGEENKTKTNIVVGFAPLSGMDAGRTSTTDSVNFSVTFDPARMGNAKDLACDIGHEGTHIANKIRIKGGADALSPFSEEFRAYETSAFVFQGIYTPRQSASVSATFNSNRPARKVYGGFEIWNINWAPNDAATLRDKGITNRVKKLGPEYSETSPHNPWGD
jgi:hypothetical protein